MAAGGHLLEVDDLRVRFRTPEGTVRAVDGVSFAIDRGETLGVVGESGCGKSVAALTIMRLLPSRTARIESGRILLEGHDLLRLGEAEMRRIRGNEISMIFQEPMTSLNPVRTIGFQVAEPLRLHQAMTQRQAHRSAVDLLATVGIPDPRQRAGEYPHQLSGGMRQRVMIAMALACRPKVLIADEPTTALDVTIQAQILELILGLRRDFGVAVILITHDLGVVAETTRRIIVMYAGRKVEEAPVSELFRQPLHPYTLGLLGSIPRLRDSATGQRSRLREVPGTVPTLLEDLQGCPFAPRCGFAREHCHEHMPPLDEEVAGHLTACWESARVRREEYA